MNENNNKINEIQNITIGNIIEKYNDLIEIYRETLNSQVHECIDDFFKGTSKGTTDDLVAARYLDNFISLENIKIKKLSEKLKFYERIFVKEENNINVEINKYLEDLNNFFKLYIVETTEEYIINSSKELVNAVYLYFEIFDGIHNVEAIREKTVEKVRKEIILATKDYYEKFNFEIKKILNNNIKNIKNSANETEKVNEVPQEVLELLKEKIIYSGYNLIVENGEMYAKSINSNEELKLKYHKTEQRFLSQKEDLLFWFENDSYNSIDKNKDIRLIVTNVNLTIIKDNQSISIMQFKNKYKFFINFHTIKDFESIKSIMSEIKKISPKYYEEIMRNEYIQELKDIKNNLLNNTTILNEDITPKSPKK